MYLTANGSSYFVTRNVTVAMLIIQRTILCSSKILTQTNHTRLLSNRVRYRCKQEAEHFTLIITLTSCILWVIFQLRQQEACQHLLPCFLINVRLKLQHGLSLILRQPHSLQIQIRQ